uniref:Putative secreted protein n=1 Tax=Ixodes ricinus TaxID=34613 RepID=A0A6B0UJK2_IXORI
MGVCGTFFFFLCAEVWQFGEPFSVIDCTVFKKKKKEYFMWTCRSNVGGCTYVQLKFSFYIQNNKLLFVEFPLLVASNVQKDAWRFCRLKNVGIKERELSVATVFLCSDCW